MDAGHRFCSFKTSACVMNVVSFLFFLVTMNVVEKRKGNHRVFVLECWADLHPGYLNVRTKPFVQ